MSHPLESPGLRGFRHFSLRRSGHTSAWLSSIGDMGLRRSNQQGLRGGARHPPALDYSSSSSLVLKMKCDSNSESVKGGTGCARITPSRHGPAGGCA